MNGKILIIGANGQLGSVLTTALQNRYGLENVIASDLRKQEHNHGIFEIIDATDYDRIQHVVTQYNITQIYHLAAILSAKGEVNPLQTWDINTKTLLNVLEISRLNHIEKVFYPSSIAVFGAAALKHNTPNDSYLNPSTVYGISKVDGENWVQYYFLKYGLDVRSIRYPGVIGYQTLPGGGTTDYAVDIYHKAVLKEPFVCFLKEDTTLPMIYMDDVIRATMELMEAPSEKIKIRTSYNIAGLSFSPKDVALEISKILPNFIIAYKPDFREDIAKNWPKSIDDSHAQIDWGWQPNYNLEAITKSMISALNDYYKKAV
ncbi:NAD-dependent epimerase/dehydratase family protein [Mariniflexile litorale]|uniref:NAD-dependent epimerase/dehydratase family protein n=1 Tax=Mariniflexile litorale TaxID=3045158 RepID=A0AAU7EDW2_9FLAO|nr:NAD-dependent epimerase/dehydratase family protein [Mariniflexile sp. KMM 9835]MDQ8213334.1 NAD-dependent epimerase/dehydratase family protein [Mariniflexile sp. KMM 9835]